MPHPILAYIDPGSGSLVIQVILASIVALPVIFRARLAQLSRKIRGVKDTAPAEDHTERE